MFRREREINFQNRVEGTWGEFDSPGGRVRYLLTTARLGGSPDNESRLTKELRPVREVLDPTMLKFGELLQRDLDDHRVATELAPYILDADREGPSFFPSLLAMLLPFEDTKPAERFPSPDDEHDYCPQEEDIQFLRTRYGKSFEFLRLGDKKNGPHQIRLARLAWNPELAKLVVLDGQHRAMALLAIERTVRNSWADSAGAKYRHFYERRVKRLLQGNHLTSEELRKLSFPVTLCWFPPEGDRLPKPHKAARKLFVDVNQNAKKPSQSRLILLSDSRLLNIFTRVLLDHLRTNGRRIPLYAVEYDNPEDSTRPVRWSVFTNIYLLRHAVLATIFLPKTASTDMTFKFSRGRLPWQQMNKRMQKRLEVGNFLERTFPDEDDATFKRSALADDFFPSNRLGEIQEQFMETWGNAILTLLGKVFPYKVHAEALEELVSAWVESSSYDSLARDAIVSGVGLYWTLRKSYVGWKEEATPASTQPEIAKAWRVLESKREQFYKLRSEKYLRGSVSEETTADSNKAYAIMNTHACQLGMILTMNTLYEDNSFEPSEASKLADTLADAWNAALNSSRTKAESRSLFFSRDVKNPLNQIRKLDRPFAVYFRYFWLELLRLPEARRVCEKGDLSLALIDTRALEARHLYLEYLSKEKQKSLKLAKPRFRLKENEKELLEKALSDAKKELKEALKYWVKEKAPDFENWFSSTEDSPGSGPLEDGNEEEEGNNEAEYNDDEIDEDER